MAQLNLFNGGLSKRLAPHLINVNEALIYKNVDPSSGPLTPIKDDTYKGIMLEKNFYKFKGVWVNSADDRDYVEFQEKLYFSDGTGIPQKSSDGINWFNLGIAKPATKPTVTLEASGILTGTYRYCYTYYNSTDGAESMPSTYSDELTAASQAFKVSVVASSDAQVTNIKIYRLGGAITVMSLVATLSNTTADYVDNLADTAIDGSVLTSQNAGQALSGLKYLTEANAMFFGALNDKLYFTDIAFVNNWSAFYFIDFDAEITGIGQTQNGLIVCTTYKTYIVTGTSPATLSKYLLSGNQGCILHKSMQFVGNTLLWLSKDGICASVGSEVKVITRDKLGSLSISPVASVVLDDIYYLGHTAGVLVVDLRFGLLLRELSNIIQGFHYSEGFIYYTDKDKKLYTLGTEVVPKLMTYLSPRFSDGAISKVKNYKSLYVACTGNLTFTTYINEKKVLTVTLVDGEQEIKLPQLDRLGYWIQFEISGLGTILEIEYKLEERQNGR